MYLFAPRRQDCLARDRLHSLGATRCKSWVIAARVPSLEAVGFRGHPAMLYLHLLLKGQGLVPPLQIHYLPGRQAACALAQAQPEAVSASVCHPLGCGRAASARSSAAPRQRQPAPWPRQGGVSPPVSRARAASARPSAARTLRKPARQPRQGGVSTSLGRARAASARPSAVPGRRQPAPRPRQGSVSPPLGRARAASTRPSAAPSRRQPAPRPCQ